ncbi:MAG: tetratricopeptide repeat protein [Armatimonadetes bacterium]|nr:tetratricopeptide repeat protein [Armatimonadota bacterium]
MSSRAKGSATREAAYLRQVGALERKGLYDEAIQTLEKAIAISPFKADYRIRLAELYRAQRKMDPAIEALKRAIELDPVNANPREWLLQLYVETGRFVEAIDESKKVLKQHPRSVLALDVLGLSYLQIGLIDKALQVTSRLIRLDPTDAAHYFKRAVLFQQKGDAALAIQSFSRVLDLEPDDEMARDAIEALASLDSYQLHHIATLAAEDRLFYLKLLRDPENAVQERGFVLSPSGMMTLRQIDFRSLYEPGQEQHRHYH